MVIVNIARKLQKKSRKHIKIAHSEALKIRKRVVDKLTVLVTAAFGLVAALAWNEAIKSTFKNQEALQHYGPWVYAIVVTVIAVVITVWLGYVSERLK